MAHESEPTSTSSPSQKISPVEKLIVTLCGIGVLLMTYLVLDYSGLTLFDEHAAEVLSEAWTVGATVGLILALLVAIVVAVFIWVLARATVFKSDDEEIEQEYTPEMMP